MSRTPSHEALRRRINRLETVRAELLKTEETLATERNLYKDLAASLPAGVYRLRVKAAKQWVNNEWVTRLGTNYTIEMASDTFCRILWITQAQRKADPTLVAKRIHPDDRPDFIAKNVMAMNTLETFRWEGRIRFRSEIRWIQFISVPRALPNGDVIWTGILQNITERKQAEWALQESESRYRSLFEQAGDSIVVFDPRTVAILDFNDAACRRLGYTREEFSRLKIFDLDVFETRTEVQQHSQRVATRGERLFETRHRTKSGALLDVEVRPKAIRIGGKTVIQAIWRDITERKQAENALRLSEEHFRNLANSVTDVFFEMDHNLQYTFWNKASEQFTGIPASKALGKSILEVFPDTPDIRNAAALYRSVLRSRKPRTFINEHTTRKSRFTMEVNAYPSDKGISVFARDITAQKQAEAILRTSHDELERKVKERTASLRALANELTQAEHKERRRIAHILHEDLQQRLVGMQFKLQAIKEQKDPDAIAHTTDRLLGELTDSIQITRTLTGRICPPVLYQPEFMAALDWLARDMKSQLGLTVTLSDRKPVRIRSDEVKAFAFDAVRELLMNVCKHSQVKTAKIEVRRPGKGRLVICVLDHGQGITDRLKKTSSFGLFAIRERASALGASFDISSQPDRGTCATLTLPTR